MSGTVYEMYSPHCCKRYIGSTRRPLNLRLNAHRYRKHPLFQFADVQIRPLVENVPLVELRKKEGEYIKKHMDELYNERVAGRTQKEKYWEDVEASRQYHRNQYTPKKEGGDGDYRQLRRYEDNRETILRELCLKNAYKHKRLPSKRSLLKYNFTDAELDDLRKYIAKQQNEPNTSSD